MIDYYFVLNPYDYIDVSSIPFPKSFHCITTFAYNYSRPLSLYLARFIVIADMFRDNVRIRRSHIQRINSDRTLSLTSQLYILQQFALLLSFAQSIRACIFSAKVYERERENVLLKKFFLASSFGYSTCYFFIE